jgi:hypothetical protein
MIQSTRLNPLLKRKEDDWNNLRDHILQQNTVKSALA